MGHQLDTMPSCDTINVSKRKRQRFYAIFSEILLYITGNYRYNL